MLFLYHCMLTAQMLGKQFCTYEAVFLNDMEVKVTKVSVVLSYCSIITHPFLLLKSSP